MNVGKAPRGQLENTASGTAKRNYFTSLLERLTAGGGSKTSNMKVEAGRLPAQSL